MGTRGELARQMEADLADGRSETRIIREEGYGAFVTHNLVRHTTDPVAFVVMFFFETLPLMLIGMAVYRYGLFGGIGAAKLMRWGWAGIIVGTALTVPIALWAMSELSAPPRFPTAGNASAEFLGQRDDDARRPP